MTTKAFGRLSDGQSIELHELKNNSGMALGVLTYGGIIQSLRVPGRKGRPADVVLGFGDLDSYLRGHPYFGCITGRVAGRITRGKFRLEGQEYSLAINNSPNHLHGGVTGLDKRVWRAMPSEGNAVNLRYRSPDGEEGYPGTLDLSVTYRLTDANELVIESEAVSDRPTPVNLTNHSYFHLGGEGTGTIEDHVLEIFADDYVPTEADLTLSGRCEPVAGQASDFRLPRRIGDAIGGIHFAHGDLYLLAAAPAGTLRTAARVREPASGRTMEVRTDEACLQLYVSSFLDGSLTGKSGAQYRKFGGLCLECQGYPDGLAHPEFGDILVRPGEPRRRTTIYAFS